MMHSTELDLGPLTWVKGEIDQALGRVSACLEEAKASSEPGSHLQFAQTHLHQVYGALSIVGLDAVARVCNSLERLLDALMRNEHSIDTDSTYTLADRSIAAIGNYLEDIARGEPDRPLRLSRIYCALESAHGVGLPNPADLFNPELARKPDLPLCAMDDELARQNALRRVRTQFEKGLLAWLKTPTNPDAASTMADACAQACALQPSMNGALFWWVAQAFVHGLVQQALPSNALVRKVCTQLGREMRRLASAETPDMPEQLLRELLYWAAQATAITRTQREVRSAWQVDSLLPGPDDQVREVPLAPLSKQLHLDIGNLKDEWNRFSEGEAAALPSFQENLENAETQASNLGRPLLSALMKALVEVTRSIRRDPLKFDRTAGLEIASALLLVEMLLEKSIPDQEFQTQATSTIPRLESIADGEVPLNDGELPAANAARKLGERQARMQVAREILVSLAQVEQTLDDFFRDQGKKGPLVDLGVPLRQIQGALTLMGDAQASELVTEAIITINEIIQDESPDPTRFEPLAHQLSALSMYADALQHGATSIERFLGTEPGTGISTPATGETAAPVVDVQPVEVAPAGTVPLPEGVAQPLADAHEIDSELLEIFIEEAREVVETIARELESLREDNTDTSTQITIRRGFHTLKGSGRMVGLLDLSEAAKNVEQTLNIWLQLEKTPDERLMSLIDDAGALFHRWVEQIANGGSHALECSNVLVQAEALRAIETIPLAELTEQPKADLERSAVSEASLDLELDEDAGLSSGTHGQPSVDELLPAIFETPESPTQQTDDVPVQTEPDEPLVVEDEDSFLSTFVELNSGIFSEEEDPTLCITALDAPPFDFTSAEYDTDSGSLNDFSPDALDSRDLAGHSTEDLDESVEELSVDDLDLDLSALIAAKSTVDLHLEPGELDGPDEVLPFDFGDLTLELDTYDDTPVSTDSALTVPDTEPLAPSDTQDLSVNNIDDSTDDQALSDEDLGESTEIMVEQLDEDILTQDPVLSAEPREDALSDTPETAETGQPIVRQDVVTIGNAVVSAGLFELFTEEASQYISQLQGECEQLLLSATRIPDVASFRAAHTLAGISATTRIEPMHTLARALEHALQRLHERRLSPSSVEQQVLSVSIDRLAAMLDQVKDLTWPTDEPDFEVDLNQVGTLRVDAPPPTDTSAEAPIGLTEEPLLEELPLPLDDEPRPLIDLESVPVDDALILPETPVALEDEREPVTAAESTSQASTKTDSTPSPSVPPLRIGPASLRDELDPQLLSIFLDEGRSLLSQLDAAVRQLRIESDNPELVTACARILHTLKGSARMAGAMRLGEQVHQLESWLESARQVAAEPGALCDELEAGLDQAAQHIADLAAPTSQRSSRQPDHDLASATATDAVLEAPEATGSTAAMLRVRADKVDAFVDQAGEIGIARTRIEGEMRTLRSSLLDLTENVIRLRNQLREVELQAETQMQSRIAQAESAHSEFDPLEMDRYTRLQELTRMMAESVADVTTVQQNLLRNLDGAEMALNSQARMARELQQSLMQVRMVPFDNIADRLYRIVRQTAKDLGKRANLDLRGGRMELDRGVLETMVAPFEHLLRNAVAHGLEEPEQREAIGKDPVGQLTLSVRQEGNEVAITLSDDGAGLNLERIATRALERGLLSDEEAKDSRKLANMIFVPGFSTAAALSSVAGRGIGMDVVKADTASVGGRVDVVSHPGQGTEFRINLPLTLAATQALLVRCAGVRHAIPSGLIAQVMDVRPDALERIVKDGGVMWQDTFYPYSYLPWLMGDNEAQPEPRKQVWLLLLRSGDQTLALHVDSLHGNQEVVVKNAGPQLVRIIGITGVTLLADGEIVLIVNPVALSRRPRASSDTNETVTPVAQPAPTVPSSTPTVMVVDDSLTVRKISGRMLEREGYRVITAKDGVDALEHLMDELPDVILSDIEMPRMDGFELLRNIRADERTAELPVIMITSRLADKHREYAMTLGANHYLGKPYDEDELLDLLTTFTGQTRH